jgi:hypothetical protein
MTSPNVTGKSLIVNTNITILIDLKAWDTPLLYEYIENKNLSSNYTLEYILIFCYNLH